MIRRFTLDSDIWSPLRSIVLVSRRQQLRHRFNQSDKLFMLEIGELCEFFHPFGIPIEDRFGISNQSARQSVYHFFGSSFHSYSRLKASLTHARGGNTVVP